MRYLFSLLNRRVKVVVFILLGCVIPAFVFHSFAYTTLEKKLFKQENWRRIYGSPPEWCIPSENPDMAVVCGRVLSGKQTKDARGNYLANIPLANITIELWEQNPISPTGKLRGNLTNLFDSTSTNDDGRFQLTMRKVGPPNKSVYIVFKCGDEAQKPKKLDSWHDYWNLNFQIACLESEDGAYTEPVVPYKMYADSSFLGCNYNEQETVATIMAKKEQPTVNDVVESKNFDHRHTQNTFEVNLGAGVNIPVASGFFQPQISFKSPGGWWEPDCLQKDRLSVLSNSPFVPTGSEYVCNVVPACAWKERTWKGGPQLGKDTSVCDDQPYPEWYEKDRLTKPFYPNIPKESTQDPYRRLDIRANIKDYAEERYLGVAITSRLWGSGISDPMGNPHVYLRSFLSDSSNDLYIPCEEFRKRNAAFRVTAGKTPEKNKYLNGGPLGGLAPDSTDWERIYNAVLSCDSTITDPTNPAFCNIRKPDDFVCNDYAGGRTEQNGQAVRFCEIQPSFGDTTHCLLGEDGCGGPCGALGNVSYVLGKQYFSTEQMFANGDTANSMHSNVFNDSLETNYRTNQLEFFDTETQSQATTFTRSTRASAGGGNKVIDGETRNAQKGNSLLTAESIASISEYVEGTETFAEPLTAPFTNPKDDYDDLGVWKIHEIGSPLSFCGIGDPWPTDRPASGNFIDGPLQEALSNIQPDNIFRGNEDTVAAPGQLRNKGISTSTWYMSEDAIARDTALMDNRALAPLLTHFMGLGDGTFAAGTLIDGLLQWMPARDVFDSVLSMLQGDGKLNETPVGSGVFSLDASEIITSIKQFSRDNPVKTFGDRDETGGIAPRPYYTVEHPLSEENFAFIPGVSEGHFVLPPFDENEDLLGTFGNPGTDGIPLMPDDWAPEHACYPWNRIPVGEICDSFREEPDGVSRTCKVEECKGFWLQEKGTCACTSSTTCLLMTSEIYVLNEGDCTAEGRLECAQEQTTTRRYHPPDAEEPAEMHPVLMPWPLGVGQWNPEYIPVDKLEVADCTEVASTNYNEETGGIQFFEVASDNGKVAPRCNVSRAGPMKGGAACNGTLEIGDFALRLENRPPNPSPTQQPYKALDATRTASLKLNNALLPPFQPTTDGAYVALLNGSHNDRAEGISEGLYTYGAEMETAGYGNYSETAQYSTAPVKGRRHLELNELYYHCNLKNFTPVLRGEINKQPFIRAPAPFNDPEMGSVDDNGDGVIDGGDRGWLCPILSTPEPEWVEYTNTSGNCAITDIGRCLASPGVPDNLPPAFFDTINMAANLAETPAAIIVAVLMAESGQLGIVAGESSPWEDEFKVQMWGRPWYGRIDAGGSSQCDDNVWSAQSPYQILQTTHGLFMKVPAVRNTFEELAEGRSKTASRCNFLDASIIAAYHLKLHPGGVVPSESTMGGPGDCGPGYNPAISLGSYGGGSYDSGAVGSVTNVYNACR